MPAFRVSGSTGQAPTTSFFGKVPDKLTILRPRYYNAGINANRTVSFAAANSVDTMVIWDATWINGGSGAGGSPSVALGSTITAPDGTSTAFHLTELTNNGLHMVVGGWYDLASTVPNQKRFAVFAKAAERTRCWISISNSLVGAPNDSGVRAVFDLFGGQVAQAAAKYGVDTTWKALNTQIIPFGNGWYLCFIDVATASNFAISSQTYTASLGIDSGSGLAAISNSYTGNGTSGIYAWRTNVLPPRAWGLGTEFFRDDFNDNTMAEFDLANTKAPGFKWYVNGTWPEAGFDSTIINSPCTPPPTVSGSVLTIPAASGGTGPFNIIATTAFTGVGPGFVGVTYKPSVLLEYRAAWDMNVSFANHGVATWTRDLKTLVQSGNPNGKTVWREVDFSEMGFPVDPKFPVRAMFDPDFNSGGGQNSVNNGYLLWQPAVGYGTGDTVAFNSQLYTAVDNNTGNQPDISPAHWSVFSPDPRMPSLANSLFTDLNGFHIYSVLWLIDNTRQNSSDFGEMLLFMDGVFCFQIEGSNNTAGVGGATLYGGSNATFQWAADGLPMTLFLQSGNERSIRYDYVSMIQ